MTTISRNAAACAACHRRASILSRLWRHLREHRRISRDERRLTELPDYLLDDMGLTRDMVGGHRRIRSR